MNNIMEYKGYVGSVEFSEKDGLFFGKVQGIRSLISYEGTNAHELVSDFHEYISERELVIHIGNHARSELTREKSVGRHGGKLLCRSVLFRERCYIINNYITYRHKENHGKEKCRNDIF